MNKMISLDDFNYDLPDALIAKYPLPNRSDSRLLLYRNRKIEHSYFKSLPDLLPANSLLIFNQSRVIPARIYLQNAKGKPVELFLLRPWEPSRDPLVALNASLPQCWQCMVGHKRDWKKEETLTLSIGSLTIQFEWQDRDSNLVRIYSDRDEWNMGILLEKAGEIPLPPYLNRKAEDSDNVRYQTVYSASGGSVAAPTAGLHFDEDILQTLREKGHKIAYLTLHVGAGTFQPVKTQNMLEHPMHSEQFIVDNQLLKTIQTHNGPVIAVGTTSMRALESIPFLLQGDHIQTRISQFPEKGNLSTGRVEICQTINRHLAQYNQKTLLAETSIMVYPGFKPQFCDGIITNFHQPGSTLLLLIAALVGEDWKEIYNQAIQEKYRFLSYGDSSFLFWGRTL